jgi:hypothetical protein
MKISFLAVLFTLSISIGYSQDQDRDKEQLQTQEKLRLQERLIIKNGEVFWIQNQQQNRLQNQITLDNGTVVYPDGTIQKRNRDRIKLKDGECIGMNGRKYKDEITFMNRARNKERQMDRRALQRGETMQRSSEQARKKSGRMQNSGGKGRP